ncbi:hypothetical protein EUAN_00870 [Andreesenia angusta]|uniref:Uncharacterized protein n=1 Tax=Andreesenia angusta TaxID=39480 RepID=A0A1S1V9D4_9FIRM|nr:DUF6506 family protein [Andreesenia angusta]OHW63223.1 hypothetical protein EUAN_00870 [Andreesenia angusta]
MSLNEAYLILVPGVDPSVDRSEILKDNYKCLTVLVNDEEEALSEALSLVETESIHAFVLCPGFTNVGIGKIAGALGENVSVNVARGDGRSTKLVSEIIESEWS